VEFDVGEEVLIGLVKQRFQNGERFGGP
jgi:hypothetical protein